MFLLPLAHFLVFFLVIFDHFSTISLSLYLFLGCFVTFTIFWSTFRCLLWLVGGVVVLGGSGRGMALASDGAAGSDGKPTKVAQRPVDDGPALTLPEIQLAPVIWAKLSGYSWWPARVRAVPQTSSFIALCSIINNSDVHSIPSSIIPELKSCDRIRTYTYEVVFTSYHTGSYIPGTNIGATQVVTLGSGSLVSFFSFSMLKLSLPICSSLPKNNRQI